MEKVANWTTTFTECTCIFYWQDILKDRSEQKVSSHGRLIHFIGKYNDDASVFARVYTRAQLLLLCEAYEVPVRRRDTKIELAKTLIEALKGTRSIPFTAPVDDREFQVVQTVYDEEHGGLRMRFRIAGSSTGTFSQGQ